MEWFALQLLVGSSYSSTTSFYFIVKISMKSFIHSFNHCPIILK